LATIPSRHGAHAGRRATAWVLALAAVALSGTVLLAQAPQPLGVSQTGLPLPRFVSLKADNWRQIRDQDGAVGWVANNLLSARRTGVVLAWATGEARTGTAKPVPLFRDDSTSAGTVALLEPGVICGIRRCDGRWCQISVGDFRGYVEQSKLWGVYQGETVQ